MIVLLVVALSITAYFIFFHEVVTETPPSIKIIVQQDSFRIGDKSDTDLILLLTIEYESRDFKYEPSIVLSADSSIRYQRVIDTIELLKQNGYENVSLDDSK